MEYPRKDLDKWHEIYAWLPKNTGEYTIWLGYVERRIDKYTGSVHYRRCAKPNMN
jgi:hypothetical protein